MTGVLYGIFAALSILVNIGTQALLVGTLSHPKIILISVLAGTAAGLVSKYLLDRNFIFPPEMGERRFTATNFFHYSATGVVTTLIFWSMEYGFHVAFEQDLFRYFGGVIGLSIGYSVKYRMDKTMVFQSR